MYSIQSYCMSGQVTTQTGNQFREQEQHRVIIATPRKVLRLLACPFFTGKKSMPMDGASVSILDRSIVLQRGKKKQRNIQEQMTQQESCSSTRQLTHQEENCLCLLLELYKTQSLFICRICWTVQKIVQVDKSQCAVERTLYCSLEVGVQFTLPIKRKGEGINSHYDPPWFEIPSPPSRLEVDNQYQYQSKTRILKRPDLTKLAPTQLSGTAQD